jgi:hypothetical protein
MSRITWVTNNPEYAKRLKAIDKEYEETKKKAQNLLLKDLIIVIKGAREKRQAQWDALAEEIRQN